MKREEISIDLLLLSDGNPRLEPAFGEDDAIDKMVKDQHNKLYELAADIVQYGLNPLDTIGVFPSEVYSGYYEVGEGNRRICALKLLKKPGRLQQISQSLYTKFAELSKEYNAIKNIDVCIFENELALRHWMEIRHMGEQDGKGLSKWDSLQKSRFNRKQTGADALLDFWDWMVEEDILSSDEISQVTKTNWQRILREKYFPFLRIQYDGQYKVSEKDKEVFADRIRGVQNALSGQTVAIVYDQVRIEEFYNGVSNALYGKTYQDIIDEESNQMSITQTDFQSLSKDKHSVLEEINVDENKNTQESDRIVTDTETLHVSGGTVIGRDLFNGCETIIPYNYSIRTANMRLNKIINELKKLNTDDFPNACGTLLRTLFELSAKVYLEKETNVDQTDVKFDQVIRSAANQLRNQQRISNGQHSAIINDVDSLRKIFNGYMHNTDGYPSSEALKNFFKAHKIFIEECLK